MHIYIDGGNFYHLVLKKLRVKETEFDFTLFANTLMSGRELGNFGKRFYKGTVSEREGDERSKELMSQQTKLFTQLKCDKWDIKTSKLRRRMEEVVVDERMDDYIRIRTLGLEKIRVERLREKGIDVKLATDLIVGAVDNQYDTAILVSSDSDLIPAIDWVRMRYKKKVEYVGFSIPDPINSENLTRPVNAMLYKTDIQRVYAEADMRMFVRK